MEKLSEGQIKHMVNRFLGWKLPEDFHPDAGISFEADYNRFTPWPSKHEPTGTNLFTATQAEAMIRYLLEDLPLAWDGKHELMCSCGFRGYTELTEIVKHLGECK